MRKQYCVLSLNEDEKKIAEALDKYILNEFEKSKGRALPKSERVRRIIFLAVKHVGMNVSDVVKPQ